VNQASAPVYTNDLKKGAKVVLRNGWHAIIADNLRGNTRVATVYGFETEMGSVYSHDMQYVIVDNARVPITHTPAQLKLRERISKMGM